MEPCARLCGKTVGALGRLTSVSLKNSKARQEDLELKGQNQAHLEGNCLMLPVSFLGHPPLSQGQHSQGTSATNERVSLDRGSSPQPMACLADGLARARVFFIP